MVLCLLAVCLLLPPLAGAGDLDPERQVQHDLLLSKGLITKIAARQQAGQAVTSEIARLKTLAQAIGKNHQLLRERFAARETVAGGLGPVASARHTAMRVEYLDFLDEYLGSIAALPDDFIPAYLLDSLKTRLEKMLPEHPAPLLGALPYRHLRLPAQLPATTPVLTPAYLGGNRSVSAADLAASPESPITEEIAALAQSLNWSPVEIYAWVKNNIRSEWYWGLMKGAEETLHQRSGNDADQAALLVALLRAAGYPARFVRGAIEFFPDPSGILAQTGVSDIPALAGFFQQAGIPCRPVIRGGAIANLQVEHVWVEAEIPYANYRGVVLDDRGKSWLALDTQIKSAGVTVNSSAAIPKSVNLAALRDQYLAADRPESPLEFLRASLTAAGANYDDLLLRRSANFEALQILPASLQFEKVAVTGEYTSLPESLSHRVRFTASHDNTVLFAETLPLADLSNRSLAITYEPSTVEDQEIINAYGGLDNTPAYLIHLRPVLTVDGARTLIGTSGLPVGSDFTLTVELIAPNNHTERIENPLIIGNLAVLGLVAQQPVIPEEIPAADKNAERLLHERALSYLKQWNQAEEELAALLALPLVRPLPSLVMVGGVAEVRWLLNVPHGFEWRGVYVDADFRAVELSGAADKQRIFMQLSGLQGSVLEERVLSEGFGVAAVSTAKLLGLSNGEGMALLELNQANLEVELSTLDLPANVAEDIKLAVGQGLGVSIPPGLSLHEDWQGVGYLMEDPESGEGGWMLSGSIAGGMTAWNFERWPAAYYDPLSHPFQGQINRDPAAARQLLVIPASDLQTGIAGKPLPFPLQVIALDGQRRPVAGVKVNFLVKAGGGVLSGTAATTDGGGIASVNLTLGQTIAANPTYRNGAPYSQMIGENIVDASNANGLRLAAPITAFALPGPPTKLTITGGGVTGAILTWSTTLIARVEDPYGNPISNIPVSFSIGDPSPRSSCANANLDTRPGLLVAPANPCLYNNIPVYGECGKDTEMQTLNAYSSDLGAGAQVILGGVPDANYPIKVTAEGLAPQTVTVTAKPFGNCDGESPPSVDLLLKDISLTDGSGSNLNAAGVGKTIPLLARMYALSEGETEISKQFACSQGLTGTCTDIIGDHTYRVDNDFVTSSVSFEGLPSANLGNGLYRIDSFPVGTTPGKGTITITGRASKELPQPVDYCNTSSCTKLRPIMELPAISISKEIFAVRIDPAHTSLTIPIDDQGQALTDTVLAYYILPAEYTAANAHVLISQRQAQGEWEPLLTLASETHGAGFATLARGFRFETGKEYVAQVVLNSGSTTEIVSAGIALDPFVVKLDLVPDYSRDGKIGDDDTGKVTSEQPWRFWVNDDDDGHADPNGIGSSIGDLPGQGKDNGDEQVNGIRDLVDFFPLKLDLGQALMLLPPEQGYKYFLTNADGALAVAYGMTAGITLTTDTTRIYLEDPAGAADFGLLPTRVIDQAGLELPAAFLQAIDVDAKAGILLLEGRAESSAPLVLAVRDKNGALVISQSFPLEIVPVEKMFGHKNLRAEAGGTGGEVDRFVNFSDPSSPDHYLQVKQPFAMQGAEKNLVWMHGYNVNPTEARGTYAEVFKRFFHAGLMGRFYGVSWYGDPSGHFANPTAPFSPHYHQAAVNAFASAGNFAEFVGSMPGVTSIAAHSLGNLLAGEAVQKGLSVANYFVVDAAVALEAYGDIPRDAAGQVSLNADMVNVEDWPNYIAAGQTRLLASEWHRLFGDGQESLAVPPVYPPASPPSDNRASLTWRGRLANVPSLNVYNFFSSTEDVLRTYTGDDLVWDGAEANLGMYSWVKQEKFKGRRDRIGDVPQVGMDIGGASSNFCGWSFNSEWNHWFGWGWRLTPAEAAVEVSDEALKSKPFFALDKWHLFTDLSSIVEPNLDNLVKTVNGVAPSDFVMKEASKTELSGYYSYNNAAHVRVVVRDWLLAEAFPATTLPMGANPNGRIDDEQEVNMSGVRDNAGGCCKTSEVLWPRKITKYAQKDWMHSDYKDVPYQHVYAFFGKIKELSGR